MEGLHLVVSLLGRSQKLNIACFSPAAVVPIGTATDCSWTDWQTTYHVASLVMRWFWNAPFCCESLQSLNDSSSGPGITQDYRPLAAATFLLRLPPGTCESCVSSGWKAFFALVHLVPSHTAHKTPIVNGKSDSCRQTRRRTFET